MESDCELAGAVRRGVSVVDGEFSVGRRACFLAGL